MTNNKSLSSILARPTVYRRLCCEVAGGYADASQTAPVRSISLDRPKYPPLTHALRLRYNLTLRQGEAELRHVGCLVDRSRAAADIGAHRGVYAHVLARYAKHVHAFEPHPQLCTYLRRVMSDRVTVHPVALSSAAGTVKFRIPRAGSYLGLGQGTLEELPIFHGAAVSEIEVRIQHPRSGAPGAC